MWMAKQKSQEYFVCFKVFNQVLTQSLASLAAKFCVEAIGQLLKSGFLLIQPILLYFAVQGGLTDAQGFSCPLFTMHSSAEACQCPLDGLSFQFI